jgi:hypothetical protein
MAFIWIVRPAWSGIYTPASSFLRRTGGVPSGCTGTGAASRHCSPEWPVPAAPVPFLWRNTMLDIILLAATIVFFVAAIVYVSACDRL